LGFGAGTTVKGTGDGVVTALPASGTSVRRGHELFRVDDQPVVALFGDTPLFRPLGPEPGAKGNDVGELRTNLKALGYTMKRTDQSDTLDTSLLDALKRWQKDLELPTPGTLSPEHAIVLPGPGRVGAQTAKLGDPVGGELFTVTGTNKVVEVPVAVTDSGAIKAGQKVSVRLPDGRTTPGTVRTVGTVTEGDAEAPKLTIGIGLAKPTDVAKLDAAAVQVEFTTAVHKQVLSVPVGALIALREGGYAVQLPDGSLVAAKTGMFAGGLVQISGPRIVEGLKVVTTS
jgi:hypothetical protein